MFIPGVRKIGPKGTSIQKPWEITILSVQQTAKNK